MHSQKNRSKWKFPNPLHVFFKEIWLNFLLVLTIFDEFTNTYFKEYFNGSHQSLAIALFEGFFFPKDIAVVIPGG